MTSDMKRRARDWGSIAVLVLTLGSGVFAGFVTNEAMNARERSMLYARFPQVRAEERASCVREFTARIDGMQALAQQQSDDMRQMKGLVEKTQEVVEYTLRYLGDRARVNDARTAALLNQTKQAASAASAATQAIKPLESKVNDAAAKAAEAASAAQSANKRLDHAVQPPLPAQPWVGRMK